jgi:LuxR family maltose regulon positive regulatory protein
MMIVAAFDGFFRGDPTAALHWLDRADAMLPERYPEDARGPVVPVLLALARAVIAPLAPDEMAMDATYAYERLGLGEGHPASCLGRGAAAFMLGDEEEALRWLIEGAETPVDRPLVVANCLAHIAIVHIEHGRWRQATVAARQARALLGDAATFPATALPVAVSVLVETHAGGGDEAEADHQLCRQHLTNMVNIANWLNLQARIALARAAIVRGNRVEAAALVEEANAILQETRGAVRVAEQLAGLRREVAVRDRAQTFGPSSLTTAELRVLQLLPTHLSVGEIADRLYVSRNTVKSQTIAIYRKLGTSSRGGAVEIAMAAGLLHTSTD